MRTRGAIAGVAVGLAVWLLPAGAAPAATPVGYPCLANDSYGWTVVALSREGSPAPPTFPANGVVTAWNIVVEQGLPPLQQQFGVYRDTGVPNQLLTVGQSAVETVGPGAHVFGTRIPVRAGDRIGISGPGETLFCDKLDSDTILTLEGAAPPGATAAYASSNSSGMPAVAVFEPDVDADGYGDETQDACVGVASPSGVCPDLSVGARARVRRRWIAVLISSSLGGSAHVYGQVGWQLHPGRSRGRPGRRIFGLGGGRRRLEAGVERRFKVRLPRAVRRRLARMRRPRFITAKLTVRVTDDAGRVVQRRLRVKLPGRRPRR